MAQELILIEEVDALGIPGDIVKVSPGYARNYLLPRKLATHVTPTAIKRIEKKRAEFEIQMAARRETVLQIAEKIKTLALSIGAKVGEEDKLFGSVTATDISSALKEKGLDVEKQQVHLGEPIRHLGVFTVHIKLLPDVHADLKLTVVKQ